MRAMNGLVLGVALLGVALLGVAEARNHGCGCENFEGGLTTDNVGEAGCAKQEVHGLGTKTVCKPVARAMIMHLDDGCPDEYTRCKVTYRPPHFPRCRCESYSHGAIEGTPDGLCEGADGMCFKLSSDESNVGGTDNYGCTPNMHRCDEPPVNHRTDDEGETKAPTPSHAPTEEFEEGETIITRQGLKTRGLAFGLGPKIPSANVAENRLFQMKDKTWNLAGQAAEVVYGVIATVPGEALTACDDGPQYGEGEMEYTNEILVLYLMGTSQTWGTKDKYDALVRDLRSSGGDAAAFGDFIASSEIYPKENYDYTSFPYCPNFHFKPIPQIGFLLDELTPCEDLSEDQNTQCQTVALETIEFMTSTIDSNYGNLLINYKERPIAQSPYWSAKASKTWRTILSFPRSGAHGDEGETRAPTPSHAPTDDEGETMAPMPAPTDDEGETMAPMPAPTDDEGEMHLRPCRAPSEDRFTRRKTCSTAPPLVDEEGEWLSAAPSCEGEYTCEDAEAIAAEIMKQGDTNLDGAIDLQDSDTEDITILLEGCDADVDGRVSGCELFRCLQDVENDWRADECPTGYPSLDCGCFYCCPWLPSPGVGNFLERGGSRMGETASSDKGGTGTKKGSQFLRDLILSKKKP